MTRKPMASLLLQLIVALSTILQIKTSIHTVSNHFVGWVSPVNGAVLGSRRPMDHLEFEGGNHAVYKTKLIEFRKQLSPKCRALFLICLNT